MEARRNQQGGEHRDSAMAGWLLWEIKIMAGIAAAVTLALTARELPAIRRYLRMRSM